MLASIQVGRRYEVETADREFNGRIYRKITKATPANGAANGHAAPAPVTSGEPEFVAAVLSALIGAGEVKNEKKQLFDATQMLRALWGATFGKPA